MHMSRNESTTDVARVIPFFQQDASCQPNNQNTQNDSTNSQVSRKRNRIRSVSALSTTQLVRKRTGDRNAQRALRQRTKTYIESLETRIKELSDVENRSELAQLRRRNRELEASIKELRGKVKARRSEPYLPTILNTNEIDPFSNPELGVCEIPSSSHPEDVMPAGVSGIRELHTTDYGAVDVTGTSTLAIRSTQAPSLLNSAYSIPSSFVNQPTTKYWEIPVQLLPPENAVSGVLISVLHEKRMEARQKFNKHLFPNKPSFRSLIFPDSEPDDPISITLINMLLATGMTRVPEIVAAVWGMCKIMQWQTRPCLETYNDLPLFLAPRASQLYTPHPHWATMIQFPRLRDRVIERQDLYATSRFLSVYPQSLRVNWPFKDIHTIDFESGSFSITEIFEKHLLNIDNWSVTAPFTHVYPELQSVVRFTS